MHKRNHNNVVAAEIARSEIYSGEKISSVKIDSIDVRILTSNVGLITAYTTFVLKADGKEITGRNCYQDVYLKRNKKWMAVAISTGNLFAVCL